ncbi:DUF4197 domain-containing protein [bacterium]|nr:DUF4197 domain-containing protein [bacterium]
MTSPLRLRPAAGLLVALLLPLAGCAGLSDLDFGDLAGQAPLDEATVTRGLREALAVGTDRTVAATGREDGYLGNELIRIALPAELDGMSRTLRDLGMGAVVDDLAVGMNRAAEAAAGEAADVFLEAVRGMTIADAFAILDGGDTAATEYFRARTGTALAARFQPIVTAKMNDVGVFPVYSRLYDSYTRIPLVEKPDLDLVGYVTDEALDGLFTVLAQEEKRIRDDPLARTTALLQRVFGSGR